MSLLRKVYRRLVPNPLHAILRNAKKHQQHRFLIAWNRGLGDIPLGLYGLVYQIREEIPEARITFFTRSDLAEGFTLLADVEVVVCPHWKRGIPFNLRQTLFEHQLGEDSFDVVLEWPDPTYWLAQQRGVLVPKLRWNTDWDVAWKRFGLSEDQTYMGVHVQTETQYGYEKNWPFTSWQNLFTAAEKKGWKIILFGFQKQPLFHGENLLDLRGETSLSDMLSIIKNRCRFLVVPDSGVLSLTYYIDQPFPIEIISLWSDPNQGVLKQAVVSPNPYLKHTPLIAKSREMSAISVQDVLDRL